MNGNKFYFYGYEHHPQERVLVFVSDQATSLYEALKEFEEYEIKNNKNYKIIKILEGGADSEDV
ncbi:hypothetical protein [Petroclostridium sp. X23]|uniref:hypothetical protein n=1 Tax=Petroclostridium sp. X23 TaxID=3045146 RepID=UPI0024AE4057|nr:hypothetical protein [Petroclostridium sp. X23]WHH58196.1 hypothetical protein QKW49_20705 [Petroclostridium sp. X23]